ncbi:hypothetical protein CP972_04195 [Streptomyces prasinus]|uniref:Uncharacterized protein n=1 Tax=Streptomyces prasinus TaxID=67345 RepID=A0ABX6ASN3_9ACTN|nr:hypothetical protein CP972_04195 [Streptomyces prasinus]
MTVQEGVGLLAKAPKYSPEFWYDVIALWRAAAGGRLTPGEPEAKRPGPRADNAGLLKAEKEWPLGILLDGQPSISPCR